MARSETSDRPRLLFPWSETALLLGLLAVYAATTNTRGLYHASLHQGVVRALVEQGTLYIRDYDPREPLGGDVFVHDGHVYANKQPGSFLAGAGVYWALRRSGVVSYYRNFYRTAALVGVFTSGLVTALTAVLVYRLARRRASPAWALGAALAFGVGSIALPYAGALHHDVLATGCLVGAYAARRHVVAAGVLLGLAVTCSLLPIPMVVAMAALLAFLPPDETEARRSSEDVAVGPRSGVALLARRAGAIALGIAIGAAPLFYCNWIALGAPWRMPLTSDGLWPESSPRFDPARAIHLLATYLKLMIWYAPIALAGWVGLAWGAKRTSAGKDPDALRPENVARRENVALFAIVLSQLAFVISLGTDGACQYGPRLLLPTMPFACLGLLSFAGRSWSRAAAGALLTVGAVSFVINLVGALYGTMFCDVTHYAFLHYADAIRHRAFFSFPLLGIEGQAPY